MYDRAALIALPPELCARYVDELYGALPAGCRGLLITIEYPQHETNGPPFSVDEADVRTRYAPAWDVRLLQRKDILAEQPAFRDEGVSELATAAFRLRKTR